MLVAQPAMLLVLENLWCWNHRHSCGKFIEKGQLIVLQQIVSLVQREGTVWLACSVLKPSAAYYVQINSLLTIDQYGFHQKDLLYYNTFLGGPCLETVGNKKFQH